MMLFYALVCGIMIGMFTLLVGLALGFVTYYFAAGRQQKVVKVLGEGSSAGSGMSYGDEEEDGEDDKDPDGKKTPVDTGPTEHSVGIPFRP